MSYNEPETDLDDLFGTIYNNDNFLGDPNSPFVMEPLQVPLHDDPPFTELDYSHYNDSSLSVPVREYATDAPRLSPISGGYQMPSYEMQDTQINSVGYNSFEQPVGVINGEYTHPVEEPPIQHVEPQHYSYADELPSTSGHQMHPSTSSNRHHAPAPSRNHPPPRNSSSSQSSRNRPIQPKTSHNNNSRRRPQNEQNQQKGQSRTEVRVSKDTNIRIQQIMAEIQALQQQENSGIAGNSHRIEELQAQLLQLFNLPQDVVVAEKPAARPSRPPQSQPPPRRQEYLDDPTSPYQPQMMLAPNANQAAVYPDYPPSQQVIIQHAQHVPPQGQVIRVQHVTQQQVQVATSHGTQQVVYVQQTSTGQQYIQQQSQAQPPRTFSSQPQPIQPKPTVMAKVILKPPGPMPPTSQPTYAAQVVPRQQPVQHIQSLKSVQPGHHVQNMQHGQPVSHVQPLQPAQRVQQPQQLSFQRPPRQPSAQIAQLAAERKYSRLNRLSEMLTSLQFEVEHPETERPFKDMNDAVRRLLAYHSLQEPDLKQDELDNIDANLLRTTINQKMQVDELKKKIFKVVYTEPQIVNPPEEQNLLLFLDTEYERRKLEEEKETVNDYNREYFVHNSPLIPVLRGREIKRPILSPNPPKTMNQYEYYPFPEAAQVFSPALSPYLMSPTSSNRSHSPVKSPVPQPMFHSPRLRQKSTTVTEENGDFLENRSPLKIADKKAAAEKRAGEKREKEKEISRQKTFNIKSEPVDIGYEKAEKQPNTTCKAPVKLTKTKVKQEVSEPAPSTSSYTAPVRALPTKKMFLNRARNEVPPALRSPPAQMMRPPMEKSNGMDSDGSVSPELGDFDNYVPPPRVPFVPGSVIPTPTNTTNDIKSSPLMKLAPLPPPQPKKPEVKGMTGEAPTIEKAVFKPQVPRPTSRTDPAWNQLHVKLNEEAKSLKVEIKREPLESTTPSPNGSISRGPIKLKLKFGRSDVVTVAGSLTEKEKENQDKEKEEKKRKKEKKKRKREERKRRRELEMGNDSDPDEHQEYTIVPTNGLRFKFKRVHSRTNSPAIPTNQNSISTVSHNNVPSTSQEAVSLISQINGITPKKDDTPSPPKIPKLKLFRSRENPKDFKVELQLDNPKVPIAPHTPITKPMVAPITNGPSIFPPALPVAEHLGVTFSDQSDNDDDLMRATDETMRSWGMSFQTPASLNAFPSGQYSSHVHPSQPPPSSFHL